MSFFVGVALLVAIYYLSGKSAQIAGFSLGLFSVAHAVVLGTAAYAYALLAHSSFPWIAALSATLIGALCGAVLVGLSQRMHGNEYSLFTFASQLVWFAVASNWRSVTGGSLGIAEVRPLITAPPNVALVAYLAIAVIAGAALFAGWRIVRRRPFIRACAIVVRSDELAATIGLPAAVMRVQMGFAYGVILGLAGVLLANYVAIVDPSQFTVATSMTVLAVSLFTGTRYALAGPLAGALLLVGIPEAARFFSVGVEKTAFFQITLSGIFGAALTYALFRRAT